MRDAATAMGYEDRFRPLELAVTFDEDWRYEQKDPHDPLKSKEVVNAQGRKQGTCVHLGNCDIGCDVNARNTLDLNYLARAEDKGAEVRPLHLVRAIGRDGQGKYIVEFEQIKGHTLVPGSEKARIVIVAAGSIGSAELLLRSRDLHKTLPFLSRTLGHNWSSNGDFLTPAIHPFRKPPVNPTRGPTITSAIDLLDGVFNDQAVFIEDGGLPDIGTDFLMKLASEHPDDQRKFALAQTLRLLAAQGAFNQVMPWFAQSRDAADGIFSLQNGKLQLDWDIEASQKTMDAVVQMHQKLAMKMGGVPLTPLTWTACKDLITPHPLGGCNVADTADHGVVNHAGEVFGYPNLFVADGAVVPKALGLNPSRTIGALAERTASIITTEGR